MNPRKASLEAAAAAAEWVMRLDRGLTPAEQDRYLLWLAADSRHAVALAEHRRTWDKFDRLAGLHAIGHSRPDPDLLSPVLSARRRIPRLAWLVAPLAAAVVVAGLLLPRWQIPGGAGTPSAPRETFAIQSRLALVEERTLEDGSLVKLNRGSALTVIFSSGERRVRLERGEASFTVARDPTRPFVVETTGAAVRAIGTVFDVRLSERDVEVFVSEGRVVVNPSGSPAAGDDGPGLSPDLTAGQRGIVNLGGDRRVRVDRPTPEEISRLLSWHPRYLTFNDQTLAIIVAEFNRLNSVTLRIADPALRDLRLTARFRSDNLEGFLRLLASTFGIMAEPVGNDEVMLRSH